MRGAWQALRLTCSPLHLLLPFATKCVCSQGCGRVKGTILVIESPWRPMLPAVDIPASLRASFRWRIPCYVHGLAMLCFLALRVMVCAVPCVCVLLSYRVGLYEVAAGGSMLSP